MGGGFTLVELLTVIAIIAVLAGIIFPVFATAREKARQATCQSNLRQIGMAIQMYASDYDGQYPWAVDASDKYVPQIWPAACRPFLDAALLLHPSRETVPKPGVLDPYIKNNAVWRCASDTGFDVLDNNGSCGGPCPMPARPTMYEKYGASYLFRTEIAFRQKTVDSLTGYRLVNGQPTDVGLAEVNVLFDGNGSWHGGRLQPDKRYLTLFGDGHIKLLTNAQYQAAWNTEIEPSPTPITCP
uniref:DUF1559 domain-containing protein n=1 Tax=uncultured Armatimonadetes bacterium TaxID=157466 RepID=A0A6J4I326_9BACT|nr:hypothetical protein AVDCRST_MAG63-1499 [uncultured Armatimonadetes bacterium]